MRKRTFLSILFLWISLSLLSTQEPLSNMVSGKGAEPLYADPPSTGSVRGAVRAVVAGISDYQSPQIPDLQYAHRDAEAFAAWLKSRAGRQYNPADQ